MLRYKSDGFKSEKRTLLISLLMYHSYMFWGVKTGENHRAFLKCPMPYECPMVVSRSSVYTYDRKRHFTLLKNIYRVNQY
jgi:hypothetical protein